MPDISSDKLDQIVRRFDGKRIKNADVVICAFDSTVLQLSFKSDTALVLHFAFPRKHDIVDIAKAIAQGARDVPHIVQLTVTETVLVWGEGMARPKF